jgi:hypothetical protein
VIALLVVLGLLAWLGYEWWQEHQREQLAQAQRARLEQTLDAEPGFVLTELQRRDGTLVVHGLRDPLARPVSRLLVDAGLKAAEVQWQLHEYQDGAPAIALARARQRLQPPADVELELDASGRLLARGVAADTWVNRAELLAATVPGVSGFDGSALASPEELLLREIRTRLQPPTEVELGLDDGRLTVSGVAPVAWIEQIEPRLEGLDGLAEIDRHALRASERAEFEKTVETIEATRVFFADGIQMQKQQSDTLSDLSEGIERLLGLGRSLHLHPVIWVTGLTDSTGDPAVNARLGYERARAVVERLSGAVPEADFRVRTRPMRVYQGPVDLTQRRVEFSVELQSRPKTGGTR